MSNKKRNEPLADCYQSQPVNIGVIFVCLLLFAMAFALSLKHTAIQGSDIQQHMVWAQEISITNLGASLLRITSPIWHLSVIACHYVFQMDWAYAAAFVCGISCLLCAVVLNLLLKKVFGKHLFSPYHSFLIFFLSTTTALYFPWFNKSIYLGQGSPTTWHSPTNNMLKPIMLIAFFLLIHWYNVAIEASNKSGLPRLFSWRKVCALTLLMTLSCFGKPSFLQGFIPALMLFLLIEILSGNRAAFSLGVQLGLSFLPAVICLGLQATKAFYLSSNGGGIAVSWFEVASTYTSNVWFSTLLGIAFPLWVVLMNRKNLFQDKLLWLTVLYFIIAFLEANLLIENGARKMHGNFGWARQDALFIFFTVASIRFFQQYLQYDHIKMRYKKLVFSIGFVLLFYHFISGTGYYIYLLCVPGAQL